MKVMPPKFKRRANLIPYILYTFYMNEHRIHISTHISSLKTLTGLLQDFTVAFYTKICWSSPI